MAHKVFIHDEAASKKFKANYGGMNDWPKGMVECSREEFDKLFFHSHYHPELHNYNQVLRDAEGKALGYYLPVHIFIYHTGNGCAYSSRFLGYTREADASLKENYELRFYKITKCEHDMKLVQNLGRCLNRYTCSKCNYSNDVDSSD